MGGYIPPAIRARNLLNELGIKQPPTPVEDICSHFDIECDFNAKIESEALLITGEARNRPLIAIKADQQYETKIRFSLAHELGHFIIPEHQSPKYLCTLDDLNDYRGKNIESEANQFAAELLLPSPWLTHKIKRHDVTIDMLTEIASKYETSLTSTAIQVAELCSDRIAVIFAQNARIVWHKKANSFDLFLAPGNLKNPSVALRLHQESSSCFVSAGLVPLHSWTYDDRPYNELYEESLYMPSLNSTLTVLRIPCNEFEEDADDWQD